MAADPLDPGARHERLASWGAPPAEAEHYAHKVVAEVCRRTGAHDDGLQAGRRPADRRPADRRAGGPGTPAVPASRLDAGQVEALARIVPLHADDDARRAYSLGKSYPDLIAARSDRLDRACDAVVRPGNEDELRRALDWLAERDVAIVPVGGGTSVVGGIEPIGRRASQPVVVVDTSRMDACLGVNDEDRTATFQAGVRGPGLEQELAPRGMTLGHMPQSFAFSTLGGWIATRSSGQASLRFGRIEQLTAGLRLVAPAGTVEVEHVPAHGAGPDARELILGSEGAYGVISQATMRLAERPERVHFGTWMAPTFEDAARAARTLVQRGIRPGMVRVSDEAETAFALGASVPQGVLRRAGGVLARGLGVRSADGSGPAMVFVVTLGDAARVAQLEREVGRHMRGQGLRGVGPIPARSWYHGRFVQPYVRDLLIDRGVVTDTLETAVPWSRLESLHAAVRRALVEALGPERCVVGCHLSHLYPDGASAYFTFLAPAAAGDELVRWRAAKAAANAAIAHCRGAVSHQHGVGTMHAALYREVTPASLRAAFTAARAAFDPAGVMNPGKVIDDPADGQRPMNAVTSTG